MSIGKFCTFFSTNFVVVVGPCASAKDNANCCVTSIFYTYNTMSGGYSMYATMTLCLRQMGCRFAQSRNSEMHGPTTTNDKSFKKKRKTFLYSFLSPSLKNSFIYTNLNMIFLKFIMAGAKSGPPKGRQKNPAGSGWLSSHAR